MISNVTLFGGLICEGNFVLCVFAGLIQKLVDRCRHILAVKYIFEFNLADKIPPIPILKAHVNESQKLAKKLSEEGKSPVSILPMIVYLVYGVTACIYLFVFAE